MRPGSRDGRGVQARQIRYPSFSIKSQLFLFFFFSVQYRPLSTSLASVQSHDPLFIDKGAGDQASPELKVEAESLQVPIAIRPTRP